jgi:hypothetical protein
MLKTIKSKGGGRKRSEGPQNVQPVAAKKDHQIIISWMTFLSSPIPEAKVSLVLGWGSGLY